MGRYLIKPTPDSERPMSEDAAVSERVTDKEIADLVGLSYVQVNRIRNGSRLPSVEAMIRFAHALRWGAADQMAARESNSYASAFEEAIQRYAAGRDTATGPDPSPDPAPPR